MNKLLNLSIKFLLPHEKNNHRPHITRHTGIITILVTLLTVQTSLNVFFSTNPQILGFATSIYQDQLISLTNTERSNANLGTLKHNPTLDQAARLKALNMFDEDYWAHVSPSGIDPWHWFNIVGYDYKTAGENLARDFDTSSGVVSAWMASPSHRENIMYAPFTEIGIAVVNGTLHGVDTTLVVQFFGTPSPTQELATVIGGETTSQPTPVPTTATITPTNTPIPIEPTITAPTATPVPTLEPTAQPTKVPTPTRAITGLATNTDNSNGTVLGPISGHTSTPPPSLFISTNLYALTSIKSFSISRLFTMLIVGTLIGLYASDELIFRRKGLTRINAHRIVHVGILILTFIGIWYGAAGMIL